MDLSDPALRGAVAGDTAALTELVNRAYAIEAFFVEGDRTHPEEIARLIAAREFWVTERDGQLAAAILYRAPGQDPALPAGRAYFGMLAVDPGHQGRGLGRRLIEAVEARAADDGAVAMRIRVINLRVELLRWYAGQGYREVATAPYEHRNVKQACHFVQMEKPLARDA